MTLLPRPQSTGEARRWGAIVSFASALAFSLALASPGQGGFIGDYAPGLFTLINTNANGLVIPSEDNLSIVLWGGNLGSGEPGTTDFIISAAGEGVVRFDWAYASFDEAGYDWAGFLLGSSFFQLADTNGMSGTESYHVSLGQTFGFRVETLDNQYEPGILTISDFIAPPGAEVPESDSDVPEPAYWPVLLVVTATVAAARLRLNRTNRGERGSV
jgi:hypothetical protein